MPTVMLTAGNWKKALLPSLPSRRKQQTSPTRPTLAASNTVAGLQPSLPSSRLGQEIASMFASNQTSDQVVNALLDTTCEIEAENSWRAPPQFHQDFFPRVTRSQTAGLVSTSCAAGSRQPRSYKSPGSPLEVPQKSSRPSLHTIAQETANPIHERSSEGLSRPPTRYANASSKCSSLGEFVARSLSSESSIGVRHNGDNTIRRSRSNVVKISTSASSVLAASQDLAGGIAGSAHGDLKRSRSKTMRAIARFTGVLHEHLGPRGSRKRDGKDKDMADTASDTSTRPLIHGKAPNKVSVTPSCRPCLDRTTLAPQPPPKSSEQEELRGKISRGGYRAGLSFVWKRLTVVDEAAYRPGLPTHPAQPAEDSVMNKLTGLPYNDFQARLNSYQGQKESVTDPFQNERIFDSSHEGLLASSPIGSSTPPRRHPSSAGPTIPSEGVTEEAITEAAERPVNELIGNETGLITSPPGPLGPPKRRSALRNLISNTQKLKNKSLKMGLMVGPHFVKETSGFDAAGSSDNTKLSSYPASSTIRHIPRFEGNLTAVPSFAMPVVSERGRGLVVQAVTRKKHPSPSKRQLEIFGRAMEKNLALGVFKDADELGLSFDSPRLKPGLLSPKDHNSLLRASATNYVDTHKTYASSTSQFGLSRSRGSRIPQPVTKISRLRTDSVFGRNRAGNSIDELQAGDSPCKIPSSPKTQRCPHCGTQSFVHDPPCVTVQQLQMQSGSSTML